jgi:hypothetical protein
MLLTYSILQTNAQSTNIDYSVIKISDWVTQKSDTLDYAISEYGGSPAFILKRNFGNSKSASLAYPKNLDFKNGIIEFDVASPHGKEGFVGIAFHIRDSNHYETLYFRPGSSGTISAIQYMPKKKPEFDWWDYEADSFQASAILPVSDWFHVKVIVKNREMTVYLNNQPGPVMTRTDLDPGLPNGSVGFWLGNCASGAYKNLKIKKSG